MMISKIQEDFIWGAFIGGIVAATCTLFLTPFSGKEARKQLLQTVTVKKKSAFPYAVHRPKSKKAEIKNHTKTALTKKAKSHKSS